MIANPITDTPRTDELIDSVMAKYPGNSVSAQRRYYEAVHQELAPHARAQEREIKALRENLARPTIKAAEPTNVTLDHVSNAVRYSEFVMESQGYKPTIEETIEIAVKKIGIAAMAAPVRLDIGNGSFLRIELEVAA